MAYCIGIFCLSRKWDRILIFVCRQFSWTFKLPLFQRLTSWHWSKILYSKFCHSDALGTDGIDVIVAQHHHFVDKTWVHAFPASNLSFFTVYFWKSFVSWVLGLFSWIFIASNVDCFSKPFLQFYGCISWQLISINR